MSTRSRCFTRNPDSVASARRGRCGPFGSRRLRRDGCRRSGLCIWCRGRCRPAWLTPAVGGGAARDRRRGLGRRRRNCRRRSGCFGRKRTGRLARRCVGDCSLALAASFAASSAALASRASSAAVGFLPRRVGGRRPPSGAAIVVSSVAGSARAGRAVLFCGRSTLTLARVGFRRRTWIPQQIRRQSPADSALLV